MAEILLSKHFLKLFKTLFFFLHPLEAVENIYFNHLLYASQSVLFT